MRKKTPGAAESHNLSILLQRCFPWPQGPKNPQDDVQTPRRSIENMPRFPAPGWPSPAPRVEALWLQPLPVDAGPARRVAAGPCRWSLGPDFVNFFTKKKTTWDFWSFERKVEFFEALTKKHFGILAIVWYCLDWDLTINLICCNFTDKQIAMSAINNVRRESR